MEKAKGHKWIEVKLDRKTKSRDAQIRGYPVVKSYKYLGIIIDEHLDFVEDVKARVKKDQEVNKKRWILNS